MVLTVNENLACPALPTSSEHPASCELPPPTASSDPAWQPLPSTPPPVIYTSSSPPSPQTRCNTIVAKRKRETQGSEDVEEKVDNCLQAINTILGRYSHKPTLPEKVGTVITTYLSCLSEEKQKSVSAELFKVIEKQTVSPEGILL